MAKAILDAIEQLEIYTTNKVQEWKEIMQRPSNSEEQDRVATAVWETYRDMANRIADLGELVEKVLNSEKIHNPDDVEALRKAREALITTIKGIDNKKIIPANADAAIELWRHKQQISNALAAIDKAIGGKEDV